MCDVNNNNKCDVFFAPATGTRPSGGRTWAAQRAETLSELLGSERVGPALVLALDGERWPTVARGAGGRRTEKGEAAVSQRGAQSEGRASRTHS